MKLRTEILWPADHRAYVYYGDNREISRVEHDAMAAHALLQAMDEAQKDWDAYGEPAPDTIKQRAAEILAGWLGEE